MFLFIAFIVSLCVVPKMGYNVDNMASKGLRVISYQGTRKVEAGSKPSHTSETLIGYIVCCAQ
jgi:hypothetical protein